MLKDIHFRNVRLKGKDGFLFADGTQYQPLNEDQGRADIKFFFDWLWHTKNVRRILKVIVEESAQPHSDDAIEISLARFKVEELDWQKVDLCPKTVFAVGDYLRTITLKWSGNNAVLRGWSEREGLVQCPNLREIHLQMDKVRIVVISRRACPLLSRQLTFIEIQPGTRIK